MADEELETTETQETQQEEATHQEEPTIPLHVLQEKREELKELKRAHEITQQQLNQALSMLNEFKNAQSAPKRDLGPIDPEVQKLLEPYLAPVLERNERLEKRVEEYDRINSQASAQRYVEQNVPYMNEIREDLMRELNGMTEARKNKILEDPEKIVLLCENIKFKKDVASEGKKATKARTRSDSDGLPSNEKPNKDTAIADLPQDQFNDYLRKQGWL